MGRKNLAFDYSRYKDWIDPAEVTPYENNAKKHDDRQIRNIANSIKRFGWRQECVVTKDNVLVIGHGRRLAALELGCKMPFQVIDAEADELTEDDIRELREADNLTNAMTGFDADMLSLDFSELDFDGFDFDMAEFEGFEDFFDESEKSDSGAGGVDGTSVEQDDFDEEIPVPTRAAYGEIYQLGQHRVMCGDSTSAKDFEMLMQGEHGRMAVTSPPYGVGMEYEEKGIEPWRNTIFGVIDVLTKHVRIVCWNIGDLFGTGDQFIEPTSMYSTERMVENGFGLMYARIWKKQGANFAGVNPYHLVSMKPVQEYEWILGYAKRDFEKDFKPIQEYMAKQAETANLNNEALAQITGARFMYSHWFTPHQWAMMDEENYTKIQKYCHQNGISAFLEDYAIIRRKYDDLNIFQKTLTDDERSEWGQWAIWYIPTVNKREGHPAAFPVELPARCIKMHSREGDIVVEPFGGSGTTLIACEQLKRKCRLMEREPKYVDAILARWEEFTGEKAILING